LQATAAPLVIKDDFRSPRNKERRLRKATTLVVLHTTEAHAKSSLNKLSERGEAHYCVVENGTVYRIIDRDREAFHAGRSMWNGKEDCDTYAIGIEVVGHHDQAVTLQQLEALRQLLAKLKQMYRLGDAQIVCHSHVAYGAPNTWHKKKHRGRKRCGMLFAMPSVRAKLGLSARPASDPDLKAKRLVQGDSYLQSVLYGSVDTMTSQYGGRKAIVAVPAKPAASSVPPKTVPPKTVAQKPSPKPAPPPVVKPPLIVPSSAQPTKPKADSSDEGGILSMLVPPVFKKKAKLVIPETPAPAEPPSSPVLELPKDLQIGRMGDSIRDLKSLETLPGYVKGGPVSPELSPYKIAGAAWKSPTTYYYLRGKITPGNKIDEKSVECGTLIFYKAP
jgi:N-acetyl-anhydromuramyl-L-alanine amidase AmpD